MFIIDYELLKNGNVKVGEAFADFNCNSTNGTINTMNIKKNLVLFSYKEDFDYISELELIELQKNKGTFDNLNTDIIFMSYGTMLAHKSWIESIKLRTGIEITYPIIEDRICEIPRKLGMISKEKNNQIISKIIVIDTSRKIKFILESPNYIPRNIYEIIRILKY